MANTLILCDLDGVLADINHRLPYLKNKDYERFFGDEMLADVPIKEGISFLERLRHQYSYTEAEVWLLTGRPARTREITQVWLRRRAEIDTCFIRGLMRRDGDYRPSPKVKVDLLKRNKEDMSKYDEIYFIDDDPENVKAVCAAFPQITGITFGVGRMK